MSADLLEQSSVDPFAHARSLDRWTLSHADVHKLVRQLRSSECAAEARVAFAGNIVLEPLPDYLLVHLACDGIRASSHCVPFGQLMQELLESDSALRQFDPSFLYLHFEINELLQGLLDRRSFDTAEHRRAALVEISEFISSCVSAALKFTNAVVLLGNFVGPRAHSLGLADFRSEFGEREFFVELNLALARSARANPRVQIVDLESLTAHHGRARIADRRLYYLSKIPWHDSFYSPLADELCRHVKVSLGRVRKCLVVDLDNTLWHGVIGEDGPLGVRVGIGDPAGEAHQELQRKILALKRRGILLAACSKNNPEDVEEVFRMRPDMPLRLGDFSCMEIGWDPKHEGLRRIARELNISTDSLIFLDDNPAEIALIESLLPEVECILVPSDSSLRSTCLDALHSLDRVVITVEDVSKGRQYEDAAARKASRGDFADLQDYLRSLQTSIVISPANPELFPRAHQLFTKTNQFNVTGRRYSLADLEHAANHPGDQLLMVHARDRFGDLGWIGAALLRANEASSYHVDNLVLSCRAIGRGIEISFLNYIRRMVFGQWGGVALTAEYRASKKNAQVARLFESQGFETTRVETPDVKQYALDRNVSCPLDPDWIAVKVEDPA